MTRHYVTDAYGVTRSGPRGAWWAWLTPRPMTEIPSARMVGYNVLGVAYLVIAGWFAASRGELGWFLVAAVALIVAAGVVIVRTQRRMDERAARRVQRYRLGYQPLVNESDLALLEYLQCGPMAINSHDELVARLLLSRHGQARFVSLFPEHAALLGITAQPSEAEPVDEDVMA